MEDNTIEAQIGRFLDGVLDKFDGIDDNLSKYLKNINIDELLKYKDKILKYLK